MSDWKNWLGAMRGTFLSLLSPLKEECLLCKQVSSDRVKQLGLCRSCYMRIPWIRTALCAICGRGEVCYDCQRRGYAYFSKSRSAVRYDEMMKELLARYKYRGDERLKAVIGHMLVHAYFLLQEEMREFDTDPSSAKRVITFVPVSERRLLERGFNQAEQMAIELGRKVGLPVFPLLNRSKHTDKQSFKNRSERLDDLVHVFEINELLIKQLTGCQAASYVIYIVDDVYTTGSTMNQCARVLGESLPAKVFGITWAR
ncbi:ComF family protein [Paenibacillus sp. CGMCC 1.16610]|uniref:ComF family protein n=1 Tax=Paenibacillus anseongense TaxID=2682845 RepID=A0ABW9U334_9BACL|nr:MULTISPECIES: ComF family protein [Paenibacillus]MBA2942414.1 ComF family protein [Paenibacillus sp. CGMCC 1.16610]MVQ34489.1 ComF family protein [Paenibacillus anseongense]